jgi:hypothetical protein
MFAEKGKSGDEDFLRDAGLSWCGQPRALNNSNRTFCVVDEPHIHPFTSDVSL